MATYSDIANRLSEARENAGFTQQDAAKYLGVTYGAISNWERGYSKVDSVSLLKLLVYYHVDIYDFMESCGFVTMKRVDHSDYFLPTDAREVADAYINLETVQQKNMIRKSLDLPAIDSPTLSQLERLG